MGFKTWFKEGIKDSMKPNAQINVLAGAEQLLPNLQSGNIACMIYKEKAPGVVKISILAQDSQLFRLVDVEWQESAKRSGGKAFLGGTTGALVGGVVGAAAGAAIGGRRRDNSKAFVYVLPMDAEPGEENEITLHIECDKATYSKLAGFRG